MTGPLWPETDPCGCVKTAGHTCKPPFIDASTAENWPPNTPALPKRDHEKES